ncbi:MAG: hypothetical protein ACXVPN_13435 [Bacteroidia bacterium]
MNALRISLLKYFSLLSALGLTLGNLLSGNPGRKSLFIIQLVLGAIYILLSVIEFTQQIKKADMPNERFSYLPFSFLSGKFIKIGAFTIAAVILLMSGSRLVFLGGILLMVLAGDILAFSLRVSKRAYFVSLFNDHLLFTMDHETKIFASQVKEVEYRYGIFYLQLNNNKTYSIDISRIERSLKTSFTEKFVMWVVINKLRFTDEARAKLADVIASAV